MVFSEPQSLTAQSLESAASMITTFNLVPRPTCLSRFLGCFVPPPPTKTISSGRCCITSNLHPLPNSFPGTERRPPRRRPQPPPVSLHHSLCAPRRVPASAIVSHIIHPPCFHPRNEPSSLSSHGGYTAAGPSASLCPASLPLCCYDSRHLLGLGFSGCPFRARARGPGASTPWK